MIAYLPLHVMNLWRMVTSGCHFSSKQLRNTPLDQISVSYASLRNFTQPDTFIFPPLNNGSPVEDNPVALLIDSSVTFNFKFSTFKFSPSKLYIKTNATLLVNPRNFQRKFIHPLSYSISLHCPYSSLCVTFPEVGSCLLTPMPMRS